EVEFVETPRKTPLATPVIIDPEPAFPLHSEPPPAPEQSPAAHDLTDHSPADPLTRMTLIDVEEEGVPPADPNAPDPLDKVMEDFERKPAGRNKRRGKPYARSPIVSMQEEPSGDEPPRDEPGFDHPEPEPAEQKTAAKAKPEPAPETYSDAEEPDFVKRERYKRTRGRTVSIAMNTGSVLLFLLALGQGAYSFRDQLAARVPETRPALQSFCSLLDCKIGLPEQIEMVEIVRDSHQLQKLGNRKNTSELTLLM